MRRIVFWTGTGRLGELSRETLRALKILFSRLSLSLSFSLSLFLSLSLSFSLGLTTFRESRVLR